MEIINTYSKVIERRITFVEGDIQQALVNFVAKNTTIDPTKATAIEICVWNDDAFRPIAQLTLAYKEPDSGVDTES